MINCKRFYDKLINENIDFFTGVPDSLLKYFCAYVSDNTPTKNNIIAANEGNAIALATGYHLATGKFGLVYMQNSGLGNAINPLTSLTNQEVYSIPILLLVGWRGEPDTGDESQHVKMGKVTFGILDNIGIPYEILGGDFKEIIKRAKYHLKHKKSPYAIIVRNNAFEEYNLRNKKQTNYQLNREGAIRTIVPLLDEDNIIVSTTGKTSRELFEFRESNEGGHERDFLTVGCMGHSSSIALGVALGKPNRKVYCFDGDGSLIMHMGILSTIGLLKPKNLKHIIFNNFSHDSVGGQPTATYNMDIPSIAKANGYINAFSAENVKEIKDMINKIKGMDSGPILLEIRINGGSRKDLGRPTTTTIQNKEAFMRFLKS